MKCDLCAQDHRGAVVIITRLADDGGADHEWRLSVCNVCRGVAMHAWEALDLTTRVIQ